jgi:hypothetical protein
VEVTLQHILAPHTDYDLYADLAMVEREASMQRDWKKLLNMQIKIINRTLDMVKAKQTIVYVSTGVAAKMDAILQQQLGYVRLQKYSDGGFILSDKNGNATYELMAQLLRHFHMMYQNLHEEKWFDKDLYQLGQGYHKSEEKDIELAIQQVEKNVLTSVVKNIIEIKEDTLTLSKYDKTSVDGLQYLEFINKDVDFIAHVRQITDDYGCSLGLARNECLKDRQQTRKSSSYTFKERLVNDTQRAMNTFVSSW